MCNKQNFTNQHIDHWSHIRGARTRENDILFNYNHMFLIFFLIDRMDIILVFFICILGHSNSNISSQFVHFCKAIAACGWWAHRKYFTDLDVASPAHPLCGLRAYGTAPRFFKRHTTWLIMILGIRAHSVRFQLTLQIDKVLSDFYLFTKRWRFFLWDWVGW